VEYLRGAQYLAYCVTLASGDEQLSKAERKQTADGYGLRSVQLIRQAMQKGLKKADHLRHPFYNPIRKRADFKELQQELEKEATVGVG